MLDYNDYYNVSNSGGGTHSIYANPVFVDAAAGDFHLSAGSPAAGTGNAAYPPAAPDLGAYYLHGESVQKVVTTPPLGF